MRITIVGCGAIGSMLAKAADEMEEVKRIYLIDLKKEKAEKVAQGLNKAIVVDDVEEELYHCDLVIEAASQVAAKDILAKTVGRGVDIMVMSVGALVDDDFRDMVYDKAKNCDAHIYIPSGALFGTDGLRAASQDKLSTVELISTSGPKSLAHIDYFDKQGINVNDIKERKVVYSGSAREAVKLFPQNVNIAATLAIMGAGFDRTTVTIVLDPDAKTNTHELIVKGAFGKSKCQTENVPSPDNPSTSYLATLSAITALKRIIRNEWAGI